MTKCIDKLNCTNKIQTFQSEDVRHGKNSVRCRFCQTVIQELDHLESRFIDVVSL